MEMLEVRIEDADRRIDAYLAEQIEEMSRSFIQNIIKEGCILVNGKQIKPNYKVREGDIIEYTLPELKVADILPEDIPLDILYEDEDIILINKPKGMVVHPAAGHYTGTLVNALMYHCKDNLSGINGILRPGIVHRIDMDTTGILIVCKNDYAHQEIAKQLKEHSVKRRYRAIVHGIIKEDEGIIDKPIGRAKNDRKKMAVYPKSMEEMEGIRHAVTHFTVLKRFKEYTYIECRLETGRTHQIRVHMASTHHPLLGDEIYSAHKSPAYLQGQTLHAMVLGFTHPRTLQYMEFEAELPDYFSELLEKLDK